MNDCSYYFMINLHKSTGLGGDRTLDPESAVRLAIDCALGKILYYFNKQLFNKLTGVAQWLWTRDRRVTGLSLIRGTETFDLLLSTGSTQETSRHN